MLFLQGLFFLATLGASGSFAFAGDVVRVRLKANQERFILQGQQIQWNQKKLCSRFCSLEFNTQQSQVILRENKALRRIPLREELRLTGKDLRLGSVRVSNSLLITQKKEGFEVIGQEAMEDYILGVLSSEVPIRWPSETLKAQAVAIRSYTLATMAERKDRSFDVDSSVLDQVFSIKSLTGTDQRRLKSIITDTEQTLLTNSHGRILKAYYHADCGGHTVAASDVWAGSEGAGVARDTVCEKRQLNRWSLVISKSDLLGKLQSNLKRRFQYFPDFDWSQRQIMAHKSFALNYQGEKFLVAGNELRSWLGFSNLRSTRFVAMDKGSEIHFQGQGFGHGVGLCQWGSRELGLEGKSYKDILKHYYPLAKIAKAELSSVNEN